MELKLKGSSASLLSMPDLPTYDVTELTIRERVSNNIHTRIFTCLNDILKFFRKE